MKTTLLSLIFLSILSFHLQSQCNPPAALDCESAPILCSLDELDGYFCTLSDINNPTAPSPLCFGIGVPMNTGWWSFMGNGKNITISINTDVTDCRDQNGIQSGILEDCHGNTFACNAGCDSNTIILEGLTKSCHTYYLWIDGCNGDICDYNLQITNGESAQSPETFPIPHLSSRACIGSVAKICIEDLKSGCSSINQWTIDGIDQPNFNNKKCIDLKIIDDSPIEICSRFTIGDPNNVNNICDQNMTCFSFVPHDIVTLDEGDIFICWEDHEGNGYVWRDSLILNPDCNGKPSSRKVVEANGCKTIYRACIHLLPPKPIKETSIFICDKNDLPYVTEDGQEWYFEACGEKISWQDSNQYDCDTAYILYLSIFDPLLNITRSCGSCNDVITIEAHPDWNPDCINGSLSIVQYWTNETGDILGVGPKLNVTDAGNYYLSFDVVFNDSQTGVSDTCYVQDSSWVINIQIEDPKIIGTDSLCISGTGSYSLNYPFQNNCNTYKWDIRNGVGNISFPNSNDSSIIDVYWFEEFNIYDAEICVNIISDCSSTTIPTTCFNVSFIHTPQITAHDSTICGSSVIFDIVQNIQFEKWNFLSGPSKPVIVYDPLMTTISVDSFGEYSFLVEAKKDFCEASDTITLNYIDAPRWEDVVFECDDKGENYRFDFTIVGGDINTTVIKDTSGWTWTSKQGTRAFQSPWIKNGDGVSITIHDHNLCPTPRLDTSFICTPVAIGELKQSNILIYPNPAHDYIHITSNNHDNKLNKMDIRIFDIQGNEILSPPKTGIGGGFKINVEKLPPGMYFIQLKKGDKNEVVKFVKI